MISRLSAAVVLACATAQVSGGNQQQAPPVFRSGVELIRLDVSVLDPERRPIRGLDREQFTVLEDGVPQRIEVFEAIDFPVAGPPPTGAVARITPDVTSNRGNDRRVIVLILDDGTMGGDPWSFHMTKRVARSFIDKMGPDDVMAVLFTRDNRHAQDFTRDRGELLRAVDSLAPGGTGTLDYFMWAAIKTIRQVAEFLIDVPDRHRMLVYVGRARGPLARIPVQAGSRPMVGVDAAAQLWNETVDLIRNAQMAGVGFYGINPGGLGGSDNIEWLRMVAGETGGYAVPDTNEPEPYVQRIWDENSSYYLLGYRSSTPRVDGAFRRIEVRVDRPDAEVRTRRGYYLPSANERAVRAASDLKAVTTEALSGLLPLRDLPVEASLAPFLGEDGKTPTVLLTLGLQTGPPSPTAAADTIELETRAFTREGRERGAVRQTATVNLTAGTMGTIPIDVLSTIDLKPGSYSLRTAASSSLNRASGSVYTTVDVPDFVKEPLSLSGVLIGVVPGRTVVPSGGLPALAPIVPTTLRSFSALQRVSAFVRVYQRANRTPVSAAVVTTITDAADRQVRQMTDTLESARFTESPRAADVSFEIPLQILSTGDYVLTFEATAGRASARRDVRFRVR